MAMADRPASFLPTIKCSSCSQEIEISRMGEHICSGPDDAADSPDVYSSNYSSLSSNVYDSKRYENNDANTGYDSSSYGFGRDQDRGRVPPQVDTSAASMFFFFSSRIHLQDTNSTDRSYYRPGQLTPVSNSSGSQSVSPKTPVGLRVGRPGMGSAPGNENAGDYFEPTIAGEFDSPSQRRPGGYGSLGPVDEPDSFAPSNNGNMNINNYAPMGSPMKPAGPGLFQRMNTIAPGPFDVSRRPSNALAMQERAERDEEFEAPSFGRAGTFPRLNSQNNQNTQNTEQPARPPSAPGRRQPSHDSSDGFYRSSAARMGPDTSRAPPPRTSLLRPRTAGRDGSGSSGGSVPEINLADEFGIGNPYHSPHDSMSSTVSSVSRPGIPFSSSQSSFYSAFSASSFSTASSASSVSQANRAPPARKNSNNADLDGLLNDLQSMKTTDRGMPSPQMQQSPTMNSGFAAFDRRPSQDPAQYPSQYPSQYPAQERRPSQNDRARVGGNAGLDSNNNNSYGRVSPERNLQSRGRDDDTSYARARTPAAPTAAAATPLPSRGNCKACGDLITGKSVSSADGRLTGRYHKACFVCATCSEPFTSAEFYVHNDMPYCERHYHEVNGSLCGTCNNGIEGQYLADESDCKHHRTCFVCGDCGQPLEDGYFEVAGKVYCERDAWRRVQPPPQQYQYQQPMNNMNMNGMNNNGMNNMNNMNNMNMGRNNYGMGPKGNLAVPRGLPSGPGMSRRPSNGNGPMGMPMGMGMGNGPLAPPRQYGLPSGNRLGPGPRPRMEKRMTRLGMM